VLALAFALASGPALARGGKKPAPAKEAEAAQEDGQNSEDIFGFTTGTDLGEKGEGSLGFEGVGRLGKRDGNYSVLMGSLGYTYVPVDGLRLGVGVNGNSYRIRNVTDLDDRTRSGLDGASFELKYRVRERNQLSPGISVSVAPSFGRFDSTTGETSSRYGTEFKLAFDVEPVRGDVLAAMNLTYEPEGSRPVSGAWQRASTVGISTALTKKLYTAGDVKFFVGGELRYQRAYEGLALQTFAGHALFLGPTFYAELPRNYSLTLAYSQQVAGRAADDAQRLDLVNFERRQVLLRLSKTFSAK
jgi:hypothetical protein